MASHYLPHRPYHHQSYLPTSCCCNCGFSGPCCQTHHPSPSPQPPADPLLQAAASHILQSAQLQHCTHYPEIHTHKFQSHYQFQPPNPPKQKRVHPQEFSEVVHYSTISSLLSRIEALESSLHQVSASSAATSNRHSHSLRDVAARTIQTQFRAFLVRRSRTLRQLRELAIIKSSFNSIKTSLSFETPIDLNAVSLETMDLLLDLDSIQGNDSMIKEGKRSISRDLLRFLEQIDNVTVKKNRLPLKAMKNLRLSQNVDKSRVFNTKHGSFSGNQNETIEKLKSRVERICKLSRIYEDDGEDLNLKRAHHVSDDGEKSPGVFIKNNNQTQNRLLVTGPKIRPRVKKTVRFAENGNLSRILGSDNQHFPDDDGSLDEGDSSDELVEDACNEAEEIKEFSGVAEEEEELRTDGGSPATSDGERKPRRKMTIEGKYETQGKNGGSAFSAPLPLKMENRANLMKNGKL